MRASEERIGMGVGSESGLDNDLPPLVTQGWYASATWVVTGEKKDGGIKPRRPLLQGGYGAVELAARYDVVRLGAGDTAVAPTTSPRAADISATSDTVATIGVNWYVNTWVKIQVNGIRESILASRSPIPGRSVFWSTACRFQFSM
jgi:phosphate-selective porin